MARGRRLKKSAGGELEMSKENETTSDEAILLSNVVVSDEEILLPNVVVSDEAILLPNVVVSDDVILLPNVIVSDEAILLPNVVVSNKADAESHVATIIEQNMAVVDEAIGGRSSVATDQPIGEQNGALS